MCGGCNVWAEGAGVTVVMARYWWVARQGRRAVAEAEALARAAVGTRSGSSEVVAVDGSSFTDPLPALTRVT